MKKVKLDISNSSNVELHVGCIVGLISVIDLDSLASTTYHHLNTSSLALLYSAEGKQTANDFFKCSICD